MRCIFDRHMEMEYIVCMVIFYEDICQVCPEQMLWDIVGWYGGDQMWEIFYHRLEYLV